MRLKVKSQKNLFDKERKKSPEKQNFRTGGPVRKSLADACWAQAAKTAGDLAGGRAT
jgi:hypothetical protein